MDYRIIQAPNMKLAMLKIHEELGPDAMIYRTRKTIGGIEVLAGLPEQQKEELTTHAFKGNETDTVKMMMGDSYLQNQLHELNKKIELLSTSMYQTKKLSRVKLYKNKFKMVFSLILDWIKRRDRANLNKGYLAAKNKINDVIKLLRKAGLKGVFHLARPKETAINNLEIKALIGPPGVGKTTTIIKLAAQFSSRYEYSDVGVIVTNKDDQHIKDKLCHFCELNNVEYHLVDSREELNCAINKMSAKRLILIDTHGVTQRDALSVNKLKLMLEQTEHSIEIYLTLAASQQPEVIEDCIRYYRFKRINGCILTKADEALRLEPVLDTVVKCKLPVSYVTNGEDLDGDIYTLSQTYDADLFDLEKLTRLHVKELSLNSINWV